MTDEPTALTDVSAEMKALLNRSVLVLLANGGLFRGKIGASVVAVRRGGGTHAFPACGGEGREDFFHKNFGVPAFARLPLMATAFINLTSTTNRLNGAPGRI